MALATTKISTMCEDAYLGADCRICSTNIFITWLTLLSPFVLHLLLLPVRWYLFLMFGTGSETSRAVLKRIFVCNWSTDAKPCNFCLRTWGNAEALARFHSESHDDNFEISSLCFKHQMVFLFTLEVSIM